MKKRMSLGVLGLGVLVFLTAGWLGLSSTSADDDEDKARYEVTVTNITRGQIISPPVVATHTRKLEPLFVLGAPASDELAAVAEDAVNGPLVTKFSGDPEVGAVEVMSGPILPGGSGSVEIEAKGKAREVTVAGMLVTSNDAFFALNGVPGPKRGSASHVSPGYDAGSEANTEDCDHIPGPPCGNPGVSPTGDGEGFVHIHAGVHGIADLSSADHDWRNPVALVTIRRLNNEKD